MKGHGFFDLHIIVCSAILFQPVGFGPFNEIGDTAYYALFTFQFLLLDHDETEFTFQCLEFFMVRGIVVEYRKENIGTHKKKNRENSRYDIRSENSDTSHPCR